MSKRIYTIILILLAITQFHEIRAQNKNPVKVGIGCVVAANPYQYHNNKHYNQIFSDSVLKTKIHAKHSIQPFFMKPDYGLYHFVCLAKTLGYYKILLNDSTIGYIPNDTNFYFKTWEVILSNASVERIDKRYLIHEEPSTYSKAIVYYCNIEILRVEDVIEKKGEFWLMVSFSSACEDNLDEASNLQLGWIKWQTKSELLVKIFLLC